MAIAHKDKERYDQSSQEGQEVMGIDIETYHFYQAGWLQKEEQRELS